MFDGRETVQPLTSVPTFAANLQADLTHQAQSAITIHFQADRTPTTEQLTDIVDFELGLSTAQIWDRSAGMLGSGGAAGGPRNLANQIYYPGINDVLGADPTGADREMRETLPPHTLLATRATRREPPPTPDRCARAPDCNPRL
jgi:cytochrome c peroxidase